MLCLSKRLFFPVGNMDFFHDYRKIQTSTQLILKEKASSVV